MLLIIAIALTKMPINKATFQEGPTARICITLEAQIIACTRGSLALYQNRIYISKSLGQDLSASNISLYKHNILARQSQSYSLHIRMAKGG